jgi:predicted nuclease of predicted toxin-antitoxin system
VPEPIRFLLDEHIPAAVAAGLKQKGIAAATIHELGRRGLSDAEQVQFADEQKWVLVTFDSDYLAMAQREVQHSGIVWCAERKHSIGQLVRALALIHAVMDRDTMRNHVEFL